MATRNESGGEPRVMVSVRLPASLRRELRLYSAAHEIPMAELVERACWNYLEALEGGGQQEGLFPDERLMPKVGDGR